MKSERISRNTIASVAQAIVSGALLFILYRFLLVSLGADKLGVWSVVLATTTASKLTELGLSGSVVKFVAQYRARGESAKAAQVIQTAGTSLLMFVGVGSCAFGPGAYFLLGWIIDSPEELALARELLPYAIASLWISTLSGVFQAALDGCSRIDLRCYTVMGGGTFYLGLAVLIVPSYGLIGLAIAQVSQATVLAFVCFILARREFKDVGLKPMGWNRDVFKEIIRYGLNYQAITIATMLFEPVTKGLLARFGSLPTVAYYEMASRLTAQVRLLLVSAQRVLVPLMASLKETDPDNMIHMYQRSVGITVILAFPTFGCLIGLSPVVGELWIGHSVPLFSIFVAMLAVGWLLNTIAGPAYFSNLGTGALRWNSIVQISMGLGNLGLGWVMGSVLGAIGVVMGWSLCLITGAFVLLWSFHRENGLPMRTLLPPNIVVLGGVCVASAAVGLAISPIAIARLGLPIATALLCTIVIVPQVLGLWFHPERRILVRKISKQT